MWVPFLLATAVFNAGGLPLRASVHYVDVSNPSAAAPYSSWETAANDIQAAIDAALDGMRSW